MTEPQVLIVGAGPVGLTLASLLCRHGIRPRIIDQSPRPVRESRATDIHARTLELYSSIGLADPLICRGRKAGAANFYGRGRRLLCVPFGELKSPYPFALNLPQYETEQVLLEDLARRELRVERQVTLRALSQ